MSVPAHVLAAPAHPDPYPWYAGLRRTRPLFFDPALQLWVASGAAVVAEALAHPLLRVRPLAEPVPRALAGRPAGEVFARLLRMNDGDFHARHRPALQEGLARWDPAAVELSGEAAARDLAPRLAPDALLSALPVQAVARMLGVAAASLDATVGWVQDFTRAIAAGASPDAIAAGDRAAMALMAQGEEAGLAPVAAANRIACMQQALDATAGLVGNCLAALQRAPGARPDPAFVESVARRDPAIHNTRRFAGADLVLAGTPVAANACVLLVLADGEGALAFGQGRHACPGERIALHLAVGALRVLAQPQAVQAFGPVRGYRPLPNARIPTFTP